MPDGTLTIIIHKPSSLINITLRSIIDRIPYSTVPLRCNNDHSHTPKPPCPLYLVSNAFNTTMAERARRTMRNLSAKKIAEICRNVMLQELSTADESVALTAALHAPSAIFLKFPTADLSRCGNV